MTPEHKETSLKHHSIYTFLLEAHSFPQVSSAVLEFYRKCKKINLKFEELLPERAQERELSMHQNGLKALFYLFFY